MMWKPTPSLPVLMAFLTLLPLSGLLRADSVQYVLTQEGTLNVRGQGSIKAPVLFQLKRGDRVRVIEENTGEDSLWSHIKTDDGRAGFVRAEYLAGFPPAQLDQSALLAMAVRGSEGKTILLPLGVRTRGTWHSGHFNYLATRLSKQKESLLLLGTAGTTGRMQIKGMARSGCQEHEVPEGEATGPAAPSEEDTGGVFAAYGFLSPSLVTLRPMDEKDPAMGRLKEQALLLLRKQGFTGSAPDLRADGLFSFSAGASLFYSVRFAADVKKDGTAIEKFYAYALLDRDMHPVFASAEELGDEQGMYGGSYHLKGALKEKGSDSILLIFFHIGFDGGMYELFELKGGRLLRLNQGYGDAC